MKLVYNSETNKMEQVELTAEELAQSEIDKNSEIPIPSPTTEEQLAEKDKQIVELMKMNSVTNQVIADSHQAQQELIELLIDSGVI